MLIRAAKIKKGAKSSFRRAPSQKSNATCNTPAPNARPEVASVCSSTTPRPRGTGRLPRNGLRARRPHQANATVPSHSAHPVCPHRHSTALMSPTASRISFRHPIFPVLCNQIPFWDSWATPLRPKAPRAHRDHRLSLITSTPGRTPRLITSHSTT